jgi:nucleotide-binding universal stress UspA family protein
VNNLLQHVLVALDGSPESHVALDALQPLLAGVERVTLLSIVESPDGEAALASYLEGVVRTLAGAGVPAKAELRPGRVVPGILAATSQLGATMIAMASHGRSGLGRVALGSQAEQVLRASRVPVLVVPSWQHRRGRVPTRVRHILVPIDGSERALEIAPHVGALQRLLGGHVTLVHAGPGLADKAATRASQARLDDGLAAFADAGVVASGQLVTGDPQRAILEATLPALDDEDRVDLIAMTTHGRSGLARVAYGSVAEAVLHRTDIPVLILRTGPEPGPLELAPLP